MVGEMPDPRPAAGEVRIRIAASGINTGDIKKRQDSFGLGMAYPRVIPHSDGSGRVDAVGEGVSSDWVGRLAWCYGAQSYRPFGTAAEFTVAPLDHVVPLPENVSPDQGACLGILGVMAHFAVHVGGDVERRTGAGARSERRRRQVRGPTCAPGRSAPYRYSAIVRRRAGSARGGRSRGGSQ